MEKVIRNVTEIDAADRRAIEHLLGRHLDETQQVVISVVSLDLGQAGGTTDVAATDVPAWWNVYEGLSDAEVDRLDGAIRQRAELSRDIE